MAIISDAEIDFGSMEFGKSYTRDYKIFNNGNTSIKITGLGKSCTCTKAWMDSDLIEAKSVGIVHVEVTPGSTGVFLRSFWFDVDGGQRTTIKLKGVTHDKVQK